MLKAKVPHRYNVMDLFRITHVWWEDFRGKAGAKLRLEKIDISSKSWWATKDSPDPIPLHERNCATEPKKGKCSLCGSESPQVYSLGWMCLNPNCFQFWKLNGIKAAAKLEFDADFLNFRLPPPSNSDNLELVRSFPMFLEKYSEDDTYSRSSWKGIVCPSCSKCVSRTYWGGWKCSDELASPKLENTCAFEHMISMRPIALGSVIGTAARSPIPTGLSVPMTTDQSSACPYEIRTYTMPNGVGSITHFVGNDISNGIPNGPDDMFEQMQLGDFGLRRYPLQQSVGE